MCVFYTEAQLLYHRHHQQHKHTRGFKLASILCLMWCQQIWLSICSKALTSHPTYCTKRSRAKEDGREAPERKRKVLHLVSQWMALCRDFLREDEHVKVFMKVREHDVPRKAWNGVWAETNVEGMKTRHFLPDFVPLRAGRPLRAPGPGEGREGAAEAPSAASETVSFVRTRRVIMSYWT